MLNMELLLMLCTWAKKLPFKLDSWREPSPRILFSWEGINLLRPAVGELLMTVHLVKSQESNSASKRKGATRDEVGSTERKPQRRAAGSLACSVFSTWLDEQSHFKGSSPGMEQGAESPALVYLEYNLYCLTISVDVLHTTFESWRSSLSMDVEAQNTLPVAKRQKC